MTEHTLETPSYVKALLQPTGKKASRKVWSIDLEFVWLPFFTATNVQGDTAIPKEALGAPLRLSKAKDGTVKFSQNGRPILRVVPQLSEQIKIVRENFTASLLNYAGEVQKAKPDQYKGEVQACYEAGQPIAQKMVQDVEQAVLMAQAQAEAAEAVKAPTAATPEPEREREAVGVA
ncbi:MAG: hypothetical protein HY673_03575 [Chloroflexi bacterium]|nr:hypothetical protein [Chloroflexota bacterium]